MIFMNVLKSHFNCSQMSYFLNYGAIILFRLKKWHMFKFDCYMYRGEEEGDQQDVGGGREA